MGSNGHSPRLLGLLVPSGTLRYSERHNDRAPKEERHGRIQPRLPRLRHPPRKPLPPSEIVRCFFSTGRVVGQYIGTGIVSSLGIGFAVLFAFTMASPLNWLAASASLLAFGEFAYLATHNDYGRVELEAHNPRQAPVYRRTIERDVDDIECLVTMVYPVKQAATIVMEKFLGRVKGIEIRFRDRRTPLRIMRADPAMTNASAFIEAVLYRMSRLREVEAETILLDGQPLVRNVHWKGEVPGASPSKVWKLLACCLILMAFMGGTPSPATGAARSGSA